MTDLLGRPAIIRLTAGNVSDTKAADDVLADARPLSHLIADKGYDADRLRRRLKTAGTRPIIPGRRNRKRPIRYDVQRYRERWRIEAAFCRLKTSVASQPATTSSPGTSCPPSLLAAIVAFWV